MGNDEELAFAPEVWEYSVDNGLVVVRADTPSLFYLNATAALIWKAYSTTGSMERTADALLETFGIALDTAVSDVLSTLVDWNATGLLGSARRPSSQDWDGNHGDPMVIAYCSIESSTFLVLTDSQEVMSDLAPRLDAITIPPCTPDVTIAAWRGAGDLFAIVVGDDFIAMEQGVGAARSVLLQELVRRARPGRQWLALLHAAACGLQGRCVLLPGSSYSGKSTLAAALSTSGLALYSDDFVGIEVGTLQVPPMPFALAVRRGSWPVLRGWMPEIERCASTETFGGEVKFLPHALPSQSTPGTVAALVFSEWADGTQLSLERLNIAQAIERLNQSGFWVAHEQDKIGDFLALLQRLPKYKLRYGDLAEAIEQLKSILAEC